MYPSNWIQALLDYREQQAGFFSTPRNGSLNRNKTGEHKNKNKMIVIETLIVPEKPAGKLRFHVLAHAIKVLL